MAVGPTGQLEQLHRLGRGFDSGHQFRQRDDLCVLVSTKYSGHFYLDGQEGKGQNGRKR